MTSFERQVKRRKQRLAVARYPKDFADALAESLRRAGEEGIPHEVIHRWVRDKRLRRG